MLKVLLLSLFSLPAFSASWTVTVTYPDTEVKTYSPTEKSTPIPMGSFGWKCLVNDVQVSKDKPSTSEIRSVICTKNNDQVSIIEGCTNATGSETGTSRLALREGKIGRIIVLECQYP